MNFNAIVDCSGQFGGPPANDLMPEHHQAFRRAQLKNQDTFTIPDFPFEHLSIILRVDGDLAQYDLSGIGWLDFGRTKDKASYVSVDLGFQMKDYSTDITKMADFVSTHLRDVARFLENTGHKKLKGVDFATVDEVMNQVADAYLIEAQKIDYSKVK